MSKGDDLGSGAKSTNALKVLNNMMEATGSSMDECRAMLSSCGGDPNRATEQLLEAPFQKVTTKAHKSKNEERRLDGNRGPAGRGSHAGSGYGGRGRGSGGRGGGSGYGDQHNRDQHADNKGYRGGEGRGYGGRGGRGGAGNSAPAKAHDTSGTNGTSVSPAPALTEYSAVWTADAPSAGVDTYAYSSSPTPATTQVVGSPGPAPAPVNGGGWGGAGKSFAETLKANLAAKAEPPKPLPAASQPTAPPSAPSSPGPVEYVEDYYVADDQPPAAEEPGDVEDASDQITSYPAPANTWGADAGKLIMSSLKASTTQPSAQEQTLSSSDNPVAPPSTTPHQYGVYTSAPAVAPAESKPTPDVEAVQLSFGSFGMNTGAGGLGDFGSQFSAQPAYANISQAAAPAADPILKPQAPPQPAAPAPPAQPPVQHQQPPQPAPVQPSAPVQQPYAQAAPLASPQQDTMLQGALLDQYKQNYSAYPLQGNLGGDKVTAPPGHAVAAAAPAPASDASRGIAAQAPGLAYNQGFGQQPQAAAAAYGAFAGFGQMPDVSSQQSYVAAQQAFENYSQDPHKAAAAAVVNPYSAPAAGAISAGYGSTPGYGAQSAAPPPAASYNQNAGKYMPYGQVPSSVGTDIAGAATSQPAAGANVSSPAAGIPPSTVPPQQAMYGNPAAAAALGGPAINPYYNLGYGQYNPSANPNMYAMYAAGGAYGYGHYGSGGYPPQASTAPYPSTAPAGNPYAAPNQQRSYGNTQLPSTGYTGNSSNAYGLPGYDDLSGAGSQAGSGKDKDTTGSGLGGYGQLGSGAGGVAGQQSQPQQQQAGQQAYGQQQQQQYGGGQQGYGGGRQGGYNQGGQGGYNQGGGRGRGNQVGQWEGYNNNQGYRQQQGGYNGMGYNNQGYGQAYTQNYGQKF